MKRKPVTIPRSKIVAGKRTTKTTKDKRRKPKRNIVRGKEISVREAASEWQIIYGRMLIGGVVTFVETSSDSHAYLVTGTGNSQIAWVARVGGTAGNELIISIIVPASNGAPYVDVAGTTIAVYVKSSASVSQSTVDDIIATIRANGAASALVSVSRGDGNGTGLVAFSAPANMSGGGGTWLHQMITVAGHEIDAIESLKLDNKTVTLGNAADARWGSGVYDSKVFMAIQPGTDDQIAQPDLMAQLPSRWTDTMRQRGCAGVYLILVWDQNLFAEGIPDIQFMVKGKKCYDPRTTLTTWTQNAALIVADFLTNTRHGAGIPYALIDEPTLIEAANRCDDAIALATGGTQPRYRINGVFDTSDSWDSTLNELLAAMAGEVVYAGGKYFILPGVYRAPTITLTQEDLRAGVTIKTHVSRSDSFNAVRGTFVHSGLNYLEYDIPPVTNATYEAQDGARKYEDIALNFVTDYQQAQRLAKIALEQNRQGIEVDFPAKLSALNLQAGDTVSLTISEFGWASKVFEVQACAVVLDGEGVLGVDLRLRETASGVYDWNLGEETTVDLAPNTNLPDPTDVPEPTDVVLSSGTSELYIRLDGTVQTRLKVSWTTTSSEFVFSGGHFEIQYKNSGLPLWSQSFSVPGYVNFHHILDVQDGWSYDVRIRAVNTINYASDWVTITGHVVVGKTEKPSDVSGFTSQVTDDGIKFSWTQIPDLDRGQYEIRQGADWDSGALIIRLQASGGTSYTYQYRTAGTLKFWIKAIDTSGNYSTGAPSQDVTITGPGAIQTFTISLVNNSVLLDWEAPVPSSLSVNKYLVFKGDTYATAGLIGTVFGTFHTYIERLGGAFTYWVVAEDVGGNRSTEVSASVTVTPSSDFYIASETAIIDDWTYFENVVIGGESLAPLEPAGTVWAPIVTHRASLPVPFPILDVPTWEEWFVNNGWTTLQDAIDDGFNLIPEPTPLQGQLVMKHDYGVLLPASFLALTWTQFILDGDVQITPTIELSEDDITYTSYPGVSQLFAIPFRYIRVTLAFEGFSFPGNVGKSLARLEDINIETQFQRDEETGIVSCVSTDSGGTIVTFTKSWFDVEDIQLTAEGTSTAIAVLNFSDVPNPTSFQVLLFNENGTRINGSVRYRVRGALNP